MQSLRRQKRARVDCRRTGDEGVKAISLNVEGVEEWLTFGQNEVKKQDVEAVLGDCILAR